MTPSLRFKQRGITLAGLSVELQGKPILDNVDLEILPGEIIALLGPSGCGKTTMLRAIAGLQRPTAGQIVVGGQTMNDVAPYRRNVGMVFQSYALFPHMTVAENILFGLKMHGVAPAERAGILDTTLSMLELGSLRDAYPARLSGGQQQRVAIARSIATQPSVLLLDEPLSALDKKLKDDMRSELRNLLKTVGITAIIVTHDQEEALAIADRVAVMQNGRIAQIGTGGELYHHPNCRFVADFVGYMNYFDGRISGRSGQSIDLDIGGDRSLKAQATTPALSEKVVVAVRPEAIRPVADAAAARGGLNSVPARLIGEEFLGIITNLRFRDDAGRELLVIRSGQDNGVKLQAGEHYALTWPVDATIVMSADAP